MKSFIVFASTIILFSTNVSFAKDESNEKCRLFINHTETMLRLMNETILDQNQSLADSANYIETVAANLYAQVGRTVTSSYPYNIGQSAANAQRDVNGYSENAKSLRKASQDVLTGLQSCLE